MSEMAFKGAAIPKTSVESDEARSLGGTFRAVLHSLGSPRLTTTLFVASIGLILLGTLAQVYHDIWVVVDQYFRAWIAWVEFKVLFPPSFFPWATHTDWDSLAVQHFPYPGGALIGLLLVINLTAAHITRFKMKARGARLISGLVVLAVGVIATWMVIATGHNRQGLQGEPLLDWSTLWLLIRVGLILLWLACVAAFVCVWRSQREAKKLELRLLAASALALTPLLVWIFVKGQEARMTESSLRIMYQLIQSQIAATVLLVACILLFHKRAGIALLHGGVGLLMFGEFFVSHFAVEQQMTLEEGQTVGHSRDIRSVELAVNAPSPSGRNRIVAIPLVNTGDITRFAEGARIANEQLPFEAEVIRYYPSSAVRSLKPDDVNPANKGLGLQFFAEKTASSGGVKGGRMDLASAYVKLVDKQDGQDLGTYLVSQHFASPTAFENVQIGGKTYGLKLRFKHLIKPYQITLLDVRKDDYAGTSMARNYSSEVRLEDPSRNVSLETKIWMNNPLRYAGETFYQSGYFMAPGGAETSTLQIVRNTGWMIPYVACMIAATGMLAHFVIVLLRFLRRLQGGKVEEDEELAASQRDDIPLSPPVPKVEGYVGWLVPLAMVLLAAVWVSSRAMPPSQSSAEMHVEQFGALPLMYEGRVKPFDTLARNSLRILSNRETFVDTRGRRQPAINWLLDLIAHPRMADEHPVFRIENLEILDTLGLRRRQGFRYSWNELRGGMAIFQNQYALASQQPAEERTYQQRKILDLGQRIGRYRLLVSAFRPLRIPTVPNQQAVEADPEKAKKTLASIEAIVKQVPATNRMLETRQPPLAAPIGGSEQPWQAFSSAMNTAQVEKYRSNKEPDARLVALARIFDTYGGRDREGFNRAVAEYQSLLVSNPPAGYRPRMTRFEAYFNYVAPFYSLIPLYAVALLLTVFGWLGAVMPRFSALLRSSAFWLVVFAFVVHTLALAGRVAISGRPPVTNLYSSAVFIGWGCVLIGLFLEWMFRLGIGNLVSAVTGIGALIVAHSLAGEGDTIRVLQAVLDTQFWLTAHVLTITLGYSATFLAGFLGIVLIGWDVLRKPIKAVMRQLRSVRGTAASEASTVSESGMEKTLGEMIFGTICFAAFLTFVGTVLGGLWADDSWGRFWGWDPKENGALIIVLWNTVILHARGARLVRDRGLAILAIIGNMVTAWSWFGVNELGVGLHSYGFTEGAARALLLFWISQFVIIAIGLFPVVVQWFTSRRAVKGAA
jgi:cytochrome c-type biogenesis protein CcsB